MATYPSCPVVSPPPSPRLGSNNLQICMLLDHLPPLLHPKGLTLLFMGEHCSPSPGSLPILLGFWAIRALLMERVSGLG